MNKTLQALILCLLLITIPVALQLRQTRFHWHGKEIDLTSEDIIITSNNFSVDKNGKVNCNDMNISGGQINISQPRMTLPAITLEETTLQGYSEYRGYGIDIYDDSDPTEQKTASLTGSSLLFIGSKSNPNPRTYITKDKIITPVVTQTSLESIKKNIVKQDINALEIINNSDIYTYNLKSEANTEKKHFGFIIGEKYNTPLEVISGDGQGIEQYSMSSIEWIAIQQLMSKIESLEARIKELEEEK